MCGDCKGGMCKGCCVGSMIAKILVIVGGVNWGLVGIGIFLGSDWNVVKMILGSMPALEAIVYVLVGISAVMMIFGCKCAKCKNTCEVGEKKEETAMPQ